jgi:hypothetical protein
MDSLISEVLNTEGPATFVTVGADGPYMVATWNSYLEEEGDDKLLIPVGGYHKTEANLKAGSVLVMMIGSKKAPGKRGPGTGFRLTGSAEIKSSGEQYELTKQRFPWARGVLIFKIRQSEQLL